MAKEKEYYFIVPAYKKFKIKAEDVKKVSKEKGIDVYEIFQRYWTEEYEDGECITQEESDLYKKIIIEGKWQYGAEDVSYADERDFVENEVFKW